MRRFVTIGLEEEIENKPYFQSELEHYLFNYKNHPDRKFIYLQASRLLSLAKERLAENIKIFSDSDSHKNYYLDFVAPLQKTILEVEENIKDL